MILKQRFSDGKTQFIDIGNNFLIVTPASKEWIVNEQITPTDVHSIIQYQDYNGKLQSEYLFKDFLQWIYSNDGQLFLTLTSPEYGRVKEVNLLHDFFNHKSDANKYLDVKQQEGLEKEFAEWCNKK